MIRGWCPSLHEPMATGDGLLLRIKPPGGRLPATAAVALADAAGRWGNGAMELTGRGALQCRGFDPAGAARFAALAVELGLAHPEPAVERRRSVLMSPLADAATERVGAALEAAVVADTSLAALPAKFGFAVDGDGSLGASEDLTLVRREEAWLLWPAGAPVAGGTDDPVAAAIDLARRFLGTGARRMRGADGAALLEAAGLRAVPFCATEPDLPIGIRPGAIGAGVPFGATDAATLRALAGFGTIGLTRWRAVLLPPGTAPAALRALGLIVDQADPRLRIWACPGVRGCASGSVDTRAVAASLRPEGSLHVSGCAKGCAHPGPADWTLVGRDGRFDLVRGGRAGDRPVRLGVPAGEVMREVGAA